MKRIAVFVDGENLFYTQKKLNWHIDVKKLLCFCRSFGNVVEATYYKGVSADCKQQKYLDMLAYIGYSLETKQVKIIKDHESGVTIQKANLDVEIVLDMFSSIDKFDVAILISGDSDFDRPLRRLKACGKEIKVISTKGFVATELVHVAGVNYIDFTDIREVVERTNECCRIVEHDEACSA